ncbi:hypothetical protein [Ralstonia sp. NFACC01]|uniref:hypothetical protein n=1 Tax=Ralstonia sp. NFACC01 TaxID=1566294 RepID=UPI000B8A3815|nr:hypothetical protein [Ralstonia sp. NFACC01]
MGILIQFPQPGTRAPPEIPPFTHEEELEARRSATYRRDLDRAVALLLEHVESGAYDGVALILKPTSLAQRPAFVVGGFYRHKLAEATNAAMQLHLAIKLRAREQRPEPRAHAAHNDTRRARSCKPSKRGENMQATMPKKWSDVTARYHRCEHMVRIAFSQQLRASPETTAILLSITQLHIETVANCLWELVRQPGRTASQTKLETLNAIQLFRSARAHVSAWMPPVGQEAAYFKTNISALSEDMLDEGNMLLEHAERAFQRIVGDIPMESVGT